MRGALILFILFNFTHADEEITGPGIPEYIRDNYPCTEAFVLSSAYKSRSNIQAMMNTYMHETKSMEEFRSYIKCYTTDTDRYNNFITLFEERLKASTAFFHLSRPMIGCLVFREGQWKLHPESKTRVRGPVMATRAAVTQVREVLLDHKHHEDIYQAWQQYFLGVKDVASREILSNPSTWDDYVPPNVDPDDDNVYSDIEISFAINGAYMRYLQKQLDRVLLSHPQFKMSFLNYSLLIDGMYNSGEGDVRKVLEKYMNKHPQGIPPDNGQWIDEMGKLGLRGEGVFHMKGIRNCVQHGNFEPMAEGDAKCDEKKKKTPPGSKKVKT